METSFYDVHANGDGVFSTFSGQLIDILNPTSDMINIDDIAIALSNTCRFGGQIKEFYSVAQHSVLVSLLVPKGYRLEGLMHDAAEAYIGDVIKPLKNILGAVYEDIEAKFMYAICDRFNLDPDRIASVKDADRKALQLEHDYLRDINKSLFKSECKRLSLPDMALTSSQAFNEFMYNFNLLSHE